MNNEEQIEIPLSKTKMMLSFFGSLIFAVLGIWFIINPPKSNHFLFGNPIVIFIAGIASLIFFGIIAIIIFRKFSDKKPGLIINRNGIIDNSSGVSAGIIPWSDILEISIAQVMSQKFLMIIVKNPKEYLNKVKSPIKRNTMKMNYKTYGSPISISANSLATDFDDLYILISEKLSEYKQ